MSEKTFVIALAAFCLGMAIRSAWPFMANLWHLRGLKQAEKPLWLRYKPTGKVLYFPARYESDAIDKLLADLKELPKGVWLGSPDFEQLSSYPTPGVSVSA